tara:strand:+ start:3914 stop:5053 length:1140 start_codon:yes stop_codon:yes gene_type:complete
MADAKITIPKEGLPKKDDNVVKLDLTKKAQELKEQEKQKENAVQTQETNDSDAPVEEPKDGGDSKEVAEEIRPTEEKLESPIEEVEVDSVQEQKVEDKPLVKEPEPQGVELPENVEKLVNFMKDTGGTVQDFVRLNADYSNVDGDTLLKEYYKQSKPHLNNEEINFLMEEKFAVDEDSDDERDIKRKKLAQKEEIAKAHNFLEGLKNKYYDEIKLRPSITQEQQKAVEFFNRYNEDKSKVEQKHERFKKDTNKLFTNDFKGFDFKVGEKNYRYNIKNPEVIRDKQSNLNNFVGKFLDSEGNVKDPKGYHKALYAAENIDNIITHFYEQGKSDAVKDVIEKSKNPSTTDRPTQVTLGGLKVKAISGIDSSKLRIRKKFNT